MGYGQLWPVMADGGCEMLRDESTDVGHALSHVLKHAS